MDVNRGNEAHSIYEPKYGMYIKARFVKEFLKSKDTQTHTLIYYNKHRT